MPPTFAEERNARVLGKAVHPAALRRLHELFPNARVSVRHEATPSERFYKRPSHKTRIYIDLDGDRRPGGTVFGTATCHHEDNFDRRKGIALAFRRALDIARAQHERRLIAESYKRNGATSG